MFHHPFKRTTSSATSCSPGAWARRALLLALLAAATTAWACGDDGDTTVSGQGGACSVNSECEAGLICVANTCRDPNASANNTPNNDIPNNAPNNDAPNNDQPNNDAPECQDDTDCASGELCINGQCQPDDDTPNNDPNNDPNNNPNNDPDPQCDGDPDGDGLTNEGSQDTDNDGLPDCLDRDSDGDRLYDDEEAASGTDPLKIDTDSDGASDLFEFAAGTDATNPGQRPDSRSFLAIIPPEEDTTTTSLVFSSRVQRGDIYFLMDTSTTMNGEIQNLKQTIISTIIPELRAVVSDVQFGVGRFDDFAQTPYGNNPDFRAFENIQNITPDERSVVDAVNQLQTCCTPGDGFTVPESQTVALWALATEDGLEPWIAPRGQCTNKGAGYPCFRGDALPIVVMFTDALFHNGPNNSAPYADISPAPPGFDQAMDALNAIGAKVVGIFSGSPSSRGDLDTAAIRTGAVNDANEPQVYTVDSQGNGLDLSIISAFEELTGNVRRDVTVQGQDPNENDDIDPTVHLVRATPTSAQPPQGIVATDADRFLGVVPGTELSFELEFERAGLVPEGPEGNHQVVTLQLRVLGDGAVLLDQRTAYLLIARQTP